MEKGQKRSLLYIVILILSAAVICTVILLLLPKNISSETGIRPSSASASEYPYANKTAAASISPAAATATTDQFNTELYAKRIYELSYYFGINEYNAGQEKPVSALAQYAFCHLFNTSLVDAAKTDKPVYRQAVEASIQEELHKHFIINDLDLKKSDLYNPDKKIFEMWQPDYSTQVYYDVQQNKLDNGCIQLDLTYYTGSDKKKAEKKYRVTLEQKDGLYLIAEIKRV